MTEFWENGPIARGNVVVCDNGTGYTKAGFANDNFPSVVIPAMVGTPLMRADNVAGEYELKDIMCGDECSPVMSQLDVKYPVEQGVVKDWDAMEHLYNYTFSQKLKIDPTESLILLTEAPRNPLENRMKFCEYMFETFGFQGMYLQIQAVLTLYAQGLLEGVVLDSGDGVTHAVPVIEGAVLPPEAGKGGTQRLNLAGRHVTRYLQKKLEQSGYGFSLDSDMDLLRDIKENCCFVSCDIALDTHLANNTTFLNKEYRLPDGQKIGDSNKIMLSRERFEASECLFDPSLAGQDEARGMSDLIFDCINGSSMDNRKQLYRHIVLSGGTTMYPGLPSRLEADVKQRYLSLVGGRADALDKMKIRIEDPPRRKHMVFLGGAVLAHIMKDKPEFWYTKAEYQEQGPSWSDRGAGFERARNDLRAKFRGDDF